MSALLHMCERERLLVARTYDTQHHAARRTLVYARAAAAAPRARARARNRLLRARARRHQSSSVPAALNLCIPVPTVRIQYSADIHIY
jgi:hypothetical protein